MNIRILSSLLLMGSVFMVQNVHADQNITFGVKLLGSTWKGDNGAGGSSFESTEGGQFGFNASYQIHKFYAGISLQGGEYTFGDTLPDQFTPTGRVAVSNEKINQGELDLLVGYYFWPKVSLFLDLKGVANQWVNSAYTQAFAGVGLGISTYMPLDNKWTAFGSFGFVANGTIRDDNEVEVGDGSNTALEFGVVYAFDDNNYFNTGLKFRNYDLEYLDATKQEYTVNTLFIGYTHNFNLD